jgi:hypothetical protein
MWLSPVGKHTHFEETVGGSSNLALLKNKLAKDGKNR